jgi:pimeloyl-ACP methyl ester carboxylesterase
MTIPAQTSSSDVTSTVIALHCSLGSGQQWASLATELAGKHRVIAPDISGYGNNPGPAELPTTLSQEVDLLSDHIRKAVGPIHLVGHSYGGAVAFKIATESGFAGRLRSLTLIEPVLPTILQEHGSDRPLYDHFVRLSRAVSEDLWYGQPWIAVDRFLAFWKGSEPQQELPPKAKLRMIERAEKLTFDFVAILAEKHVTAAATALRVPTLLVSGGQSPYLTQRIAWRLAAAIPGIKTKQISAGGHMLPLTHAAEINRDIASHIAWADELAGLSLAPAETPAQVDASARG